MNDGSSVVKNKKVYTKIYEVSSVLLAVQQVVLWTKIRLHSEKLDYKLSKISLYNGESSIFLREEAGKNMTNPNALHRRTEEIFDEARYDEDYSRVNYIIPRQSRWKYAETKLDGDEGQVEKTFPRRGLGRYGKIKHRMLLCKQFLGTIYDILKSIPFL